MGTITTIAGHKGGTGKTTTAINLAAAVGKYHDKRVLVVDTDIQLNATQLLTENVQEKWRYSLYDILRADSETTADQCVLWTGYENLYVLPNIKTTAGLEQELIVKYPEGSFFLLKKRLADYARENFDVTIIDSPANLGTFPLLSLLASDYAITPTDTGSSFSLSGLDEVGSWIEKVRENFNENLVDLGVLLTKVRPNELAHKATLKLIEDDFPAEKVFKTRIPRNAAVQSAERFRQTLFKFRSPAPAAKAYRELAAEFLERIGAA